LDHEKHEMSENRESANADIDQPIPRLTGDIAAGRAECDITFSGTFGSESQMFRKKTQ
jgi:hypothetical protein